MIQLEDCKCIAAFLDVEPQIILAVAQVESRGDITGFLFEPHIFSRLTNGKYDKTHKHLSWPSWDRTKYPKTKALKQKQFAEAAELNSHYAYQSASWGIFQIMGFHYKVLKFENPMAMCEKLRSGIEPNLIAFGRIVEHMGIVVELKHKNWAQFARIYNGPGYKQNNYDTKMAVAYNEIIENLKLNSEIRNA